MIQYDIIVCSVCMSIHDIYIINWSKRNLNKYPTQSLIKKMKHNTMKNILIVCCILMQSIFALGQQECDTVKLNLVSEFAFGEFKSQINVEGFNAVSAALVQIGWNSEVVKLKDFTFNVGNDNQLMFNETEDWVRILFTTNVFPATAFLPDGESLLDAYFEIIGPGDPQITIQEGVNFQTEIVILDQAACLEVTSSNTIIEGGILSGSVLKDNNENCAMDNDDSPLLGWTISFTNDEHEIYRTTNSEGQYSALLPFGDYEVKVEAPNHTWELCQESYNISIVDNQSEIEQSFLAKSLIECPLMLVDIYTPRLRRCFENVYFVEWENQGSGVAENGSVVVQLDEKLDYVSTSVSNATYDAIEHTVTVELGDLEPNQGGKFHIKVVVNCDNTILGESHCTTAFVYPNERCSVDPEWSGAELGIEGICEGDSIRFIITNIGNGPMDQTSGFIVVEDQVMRTEDEVLLDEGEAFEIAFEANGSTYRIILEQPADFPFEEMISQAIEACGENEDGTFSIGYVTMFGDFDASPFYDIHCMQNIGSYDPNDKQAWPKGYENTDLIENYVPLDYMIRFQNTGTDTAFTVVLTDQISEHLDLSTLKVGSASHDYTYSIEEDRTLVFRFDNILLPDSTTNEPASNGFVAFTIEQNEGNVDGTIIDNQADIYFDFNDPIITNLVRREVGSNFVEIILSKHNLLQNIYGIYPNPVSDRIAVNIPDSYQDLRFELYDLDARIVRTGGVNNGDKTIDVSSLNEGIYIIRLFDGISDLGTQKLIIIK